MRSRVSIWLLALCLAWQGIAVAGAGDRMSSLDDAEHERMHRENLLHHHGVDGKITPDDSMSSLLHVVADLGSVVSIASLMTVGPLSSTPEAPEKLAAAIPATACLDRPTRPPQASV